MNHWPFRLQPTTFPSHMSASMSKNKGKMIPHHLFQKCVRLIKNKINSKPSVLNNNDPTFINRNAVIESKYCSTTSGHHLLFPTDNEESNNTQKLYSFLQDHLYSEATKHGLELLFPLNLLNTIAKDVVQISQSEPCGLSGCSLFITIQNKSNGILNINHLQCDSFSVPTFELHLTLRKDKKYWFKLKELFAPVLPGCHNKSKAMEVYIKPEYNITKNKLYRSKWTLPKFIIYSI